jgi:hypothetical protein
MRFHDLLRHHITAHCCATGDTLHTVATRIGLKNGNVLSMAMNPRYGAGLAPARLPALARELGLTHRQKLQLYLARSREGNGLGNLDHADLLDLLRTTLRALRGARARA